MPEPIESWWARRQRSKDIAVPYPVGRYRSEWEPYPVLVRQYHPDLNRGVTLTQIPPAADVYLVWECDAGHRFAATPSEQRSRPNGSRRKSSWCPECHAAAIGRARKTVSGAGAGAGAGAGDAAATYACGHPCDDRLLWADRSGMCPLCARLAGSGLSREKLIELAVPSCRIELAVEATTIAAYRWQCPNGHPSFEARVEKIIDGKRCPVCVHAAAGADRVQVGEPFVSRWAPRPASAAEPDLRRRLQASLDLDLSFNAVRVARPFYGHIEVWPDIILSELRVVIEYDTTGRTGLEHVGRREESDRRKDRLLRQAGWEVVRVRCGRLQPLGPHDIVSSGVSDNLVARILERLAEIRGALIVASYRT